MPAARRPAGDGRAHPRLHREPAVTRRRVDRGELGLLAGLSLLSLWVLGLKVWHAAAHGWVWTGGDGLYPVDQFQYMAWVRDAAAHGLSSDLFVLHPTAHDYLQPAVLAAGALSRLGVPVWLSVLAWKPLAVLGFFAAVRGYVHRSLAGAWPRRAALALALFGGSVTLLYGGVTVIGDLFPGFLSWGYTLALMALGAMVAALVQVDAAERSGRLPWRAGLLGALASWLHPWHGELLVLTLLGGVVLEHRAGVLARPRLMGLTVVLGLTVLPLAYYAMLGLLDPAWAHARVASKHAFPLGSALLYLVPLALPALAGARRQGAGFLPAATRAWPLGALLLFLVSASRLSATPLHALEGITVPLGVLAVQGWERQRALRHRPALAVALVALLTLPTTAVELATARDLVAPQAGDSDFIQPDERSALEFLSRLPAGGGVLARSYLGVLVPELTGRHTYVGDCLWSGAHCPQRLVSVRALFTGGMGAAAARRFVLSTGARFLLADCRGGADLPRLLGGVVVRRWRFGCASVEEVGPTA